ncbi:hypothetical protein GCM10017776_53750 [Streptomyces griseoluteus]|nr:hypothetical protein GCM10017776_53750 [Streptomyces griseoluteus]
MTPRMEECPVRIDTSKPHPARVYDWLLGGKDNYPVDQQVGETLPEQSRRSAARNREFMHRAAAWLAARGIDQFLDIGTGIPTEPNLHQSDPAREERRRVRRRRKLRLKAALLGRSRGGRTSRVHLAADRRCRPLAFILTAGQAADIRLHLPRTKVPPYGNGKLVLRS